MRLQTIQDSNGNETGVFIPIHDWLKIKDSYPDIEEVDKELPLWKKELIDERIAAIEKNPSRMLSDSKLLDELRRKA